MRNSVLFLINLATTFALSTAAHSAPRQTKYNELPCPKPKELAGVDPATIKYIRNFSDFDSIREDLSANYILCTDIDGQNRLFNPIGEGQLWPFSSNYYADIFTGNFYGNSHTIRNLRILEGTTSQAGIFRKIEGSVRNVIFENIVVTCMSWCGVVAGQLDYAQIAKVQVLSGSVFAGVPEDSTDSAIPSRAGGIAGYSNAASFIGSSSAVRGRYTLGGVGPVRSGECLTFGGENWFISSECTER